MRLLFAGYLYTNPTNPKKYKLKTPREPYYSLIPKINKKVSTKLRSIAIANNELIIQFYFLGRYCSLRTTTLRTILSETSLFTFCFFSS